VCNVLAPSALLSSRTSPALSPPPRLLFCRPHHHQQQDQVALEKEKNDLRDINEILTSELKVANVVCENLEKKKAELEEQLDRTQSDFRATVDRMTREREELVGRLQDQIAGYQDQLKGLDEFIQQKMELEGELGRLKEELAITRKTYQEQISDMERAHVQVRQSCSLFYLYICIYIWNRLLVCGGRGTREGEEQRKEGDASFLPFLLTPLPLS
jgi:septal ring factor EnvC (AmiA/AmiB activator)